MVHSCQPMIWFIFIVSFMPCSMLLYLIIQIMHILSSRSLQCTLVSKSKNQAAAADWQCHLNPVMQSCNMHAVINVMYWNWKKIHYRSWIKADYAWWILSCNLPCMQVFIKIFCVQAVTNEPYFFALIPGKDILHTWNICQAIRYCKSQDYCLLNPCMHMTFS